jgi:hypothetical protein
MEGRLPHSVVRAGRGPAPRSHRRPTALECDPVPHVATRYQPLQRTTTRCNAVQRIATRTLQSTSLAIKIGARDDLSRCLRFPGSIPLVAVFSVFIIIQHDRKGRGVQFLGHLQRGFDALNTVLMPRLKSEARIVLEEREFLRFGAIEDPTEDADILE